MKIDDIQEKIIDEEIKKVRELRREYKTKRAQMRGREEKYEEEDDYTIIGIALLQMADSLKEALDILGRKEPCK